MIEPPEPPDVRFVAPVRPGHDDDVAGTVTSIEEGRAMIEPGTTGPEGTCVDGVTTGPLPGPPEMKGEPP